MLAQAHTAHGLHRMQRSERGQAGKQGEESCESRGSEGWVLPSIQPRSCGSADTSAFGTMTHQSGDPIPGAWWEPCDCDRAVCRWVEALPPENVSWRTVSQKAGRNAAHNSAGGKGGSSVCDLWSLQKCSQETYHPHSRGPWDPFIHSFAVKCRLTMRYSLGNVITAQVS